MRQIREEIDDGWDQFLMRREAKMCYSGGQAVKQTRKAEEKDEQDSIPDGLLS